jgi:hypothetical protein
MSATGRSISNFSTAPTVTSGSTSNTAANFRSLPGATWIGSKVGPPAGRRFSFVTASV